jgi:hypothetical protein
MFDQEGFGSPAEARRMNGRVGSKIPGDTGPWRSCHTNRDHMFGGLRKVWHICHSMKFRFQDHLYHIMYIIYIYITVHTYYSFMCLFEA